MKEHKQCKEVEEYLSWKGIYAQRASISYKIWLDRFGQITNKKLSEVDIGDVVKYYSWLKMNKYRPRSISYAMTIVHNYFDFYKKRGVSCISPDLIKIPKSRSTAHQAITREDYQKLLSSIKESDFWQLQKIVILRLLYDSGIRVGELCSINISNIKNCSAIIDSEKNNQMRQIFWSDETNVYVQKFISQRIAISESRALFVGRFGDGTPSKRMTSRSIQRIIKALVKKAELNKKITPHSFRHGKAHRILSEGGSVKSVQCVLGHQHPISSFAYLQFTDVETEKEARKYLVT